MYVRRVLAVRVRKRQDFGLRPRGFVHGGPEHPNLNSSAALTIFLFQLLWEGAPNSCGHPELLKTGNGGYRAPHGAHALEEVVSSLGTTGRKRGLGGCGWGGRRHRRKFVFLGHIGA